MGAIEKAADSVVSKLKEKLVTTAESYLVERLKEVLKPLIIATALENQKAQMTDVYPNAKLDPDDPDSENSLLPTPLIVVNGMPSNPLEYDELLADGDEAYLELATRGNTEELVYNDYAVEVEGYLQVTKALYQSTIVEFDNQVSSAPLTLEEVDTLAELRDYLSDASSLPANGDKPKFSVPMPGYLNVLDLVTSLINAIAAVDNMIVCIGKAAILNTKYQLLLTENIVKLTTLFTTTAANPYTTSMSGAQLVEGTTTLVNEMDELSSSAQVNLKEYLTASKLVTRPLSILGKFSTLLAGPYGLLGAALILESGSDKGVKVFEKVNAIVATISSISKLISSKLINPLNTYMRINTYMMSSLSNALPEPQPDNSATSPELDAALGSLDADAKSAEANNATMKQQSDSNTNNLKSAASESYESYKTNYYVPAVDLQADNQDTRAELNKIGTGLPVATRVVVTKSIKTDPALSGLTHYTNVRLATRTDGIGSTTTIGELITEMDAMASKVDEVVNNYGVELHNRELARDEVNSQFPS